MSRRRAPAPRRPLGRQASVAILLVAALATGQVVEQFMPDGDDVSRPFERPGVVGEPLALRYGVVQVGDPLTTASVEIDGAVQTTAGVYVVVPVTFTATGEPGQISYVAIRDTRGRRFATGSQRNPTDLAGLAQPGVPQRAYVTIELPADSVAGAELVVARESNDEDHRRDDVGVVDLDLTAADADVAADETVRLADVWADDGAGS